MTKTELNRDIKRLKNRANKFYEKLHSELKANSEFEEDELKSELHRLYYADKEMKHMNKDSVLVMLRLNQKLRVIPLHQFGLYIDIIA